jgi:MFS family permease
MANIASETEATPSNTRGARRFYYGWVCVWVAALAMVATLPGRTMGLGLITEPLLEDMNLSRTNYGEINLWATLIGAGFGVGGGRLLDRFGARSVLALLMLALGLVVVVMTSVSGYWGLLLGVTLTRGLGQSALSTASISVVGKWFERKIDHAMGIYAVSLTVGFMIAIPGMEAAVKQFGWRPAWNGMGLALLLVAAPLAWAFTRNSPEEVGVPIDGEASGEAQVAAEPVGLTLGAALATPAFWAFSLGGFLFNAAYSGITLFNESILKGTGYTGSASGPLIVIVFTGLAANIGAGWLAGRWSVSRLMGVGMLLLAVSLLVLPWIRSTAEVMAYAAAIGVSGGVVTVIFFSCWSKAFGRLHLGKIQGAAQGVTVLASAAGPLLLAECHARTGSYDAMFLALAPLAALLALFCWFVRLPRIPAANR